MNGRPVAVATSMIVVGTAGLVIGAVALVSGTNWPMVGLVALGVLLVVLGAALLRQTNRAARRRRSHTDGAGYGLYAGPTGDVGSGWHADRQRDGDHDHSDGTEPVGGSTDSGGGWSGWGWSSGDSGGGSSGGGWSGGDSGGGWSGGGDSGGGGGSS
ncbi:hypothetical protein ACFYL6_16420 [Micromonospora sp. NPDC007208]|uniref:hypothetical protein n=1 Tax=Micromonospora sp. NPDC007208 TaxID=3364236 RepID=UPI003693CB24